MKSALVPFALLVVFAEGTNVTIRVFADPQCVDAAPGANKFTFPSGSCRAAASHRQSSSVDQSLTCTDSGTIQVIDYFSRDGSCTSKLAGRFYKTGQCLLEPYDKHLWAEFSCDGSPAPTPPSPPSPPSPQPGNQNIVQLAEATPDLSTLVKALTAGGLTGTLSGKGPFTVFAPTNEAFSKLGAKALNDLLANKEKLDKVLEYHVLAAELTKLKLMSVQSAVTLEGDAITVTSHPSRSVIKINDAKVIKADVGATNGVVHLIDTVLMPPNDLLV